MREADGLFIQIRLTGPTFNWQLMLLTDTGMVYGVSFADDQLDVNPLFRLCMQPNDIGDAQEPLITKQIYSSQNGALFLTGEGSAFMKVHTPGLYQKMFVHQQALDPDASFTPVCQYVYIYSRPIGHEFGKNSVRSQVLSCSDVVKQPA
ncbi:unnamed protein product [Arctogadus glacialis]